MMPSTVSAEALAAEFRALWRDARRRKTLGRIVIHERQFENWWKFELATHLWELAAKHGAYVWVEDDGRTDVVLAHALDDRANRLNPDGPLRVRIELKTIGTFWTNAAKAFEEPNKKRLADDMDTAVAEAATSRPFFAVGLLLTHAHDAMDERMLAFLSYARDLGQRKQLRRVLDEPIKIRVPKHAASAHQFLWVTEPGS